MQNEMLKSLLLLIATLSCAGCASTPVHNSVPAPYFPTCDAINSMAEVSETLIDTQVENTAVMLKLRDRQTADDRQRFGHCAEP